MKTDWIAGLLGPWSAELTLGSIFLRLAVSMALAAIIGCERSSKRHSAGLRTFILVSLAGTATMLIDQYLMDVLPITIPLLSAAAVIGMTTISGNSILFSSKNQIKGLTTSVGLWCCGIVGLALGAGLYTLALVLFFALLCSMSGLPALETHLKDRSNHFEVHLELKNKSDLPDSEENVVRLKAHLAELGLDYPVFVVSAATHQGFDALLDKTGDMLEALPPIVHFEEEVSYDDSVKPGTFEVVRDGAVFEVVGSSMQRLIDSVNFDDEESMSWFHRTLRKWGVIDALRKAGAQEGDTVRIIDMEFDFVE